MQLILYNHVQTLIYCIVPLSCFAVCLCSVLLCLYRQILVLLWLNRILLSIDHNAHEFVFVSGQNPEGGFSFPLGAPLSVAGIQLAVWQLYQSSATSIQSGIENQCVYGLLAYSFLRLLIFCISIAPFIMMQSCVASSYSTRMSFGFSWSSIDVTMTGH